MKRSCCCILASIAILTSMTGCVTTPAGEQMRLADKMLRQSALKTRQGDFTAADAAADALGSSVRKGVELALADESQKIQTENLKSLLNAWETGPYRDLKKALEGKQGNSAIKAFDNLRGQCINCHTVIGRPKIAISGER